ncbi:MAG: fimbrillin family protein [Alistipes sp.]|nr:fimbrillin family protein [Alistipes sp.]
MKKIFTLMAAVAAMVSCSENLENVPATPETDRLPINISTTLTRATDSAFEAGDKVGIFVVNEPNELATSGNHVDNMGFTYSSVWTPDTPIYWLDKSTKADFYCYYPYAQVANTAAHSFATKADQSTLANYKASEFLWGKTAGIAPTEEAVNITTHHSFSNMVIVLKPGDGFTTESLAAATKSVKICGIKTNATINLSTGVATANGNATEVTPYLDGAQYRALIVPQTTAGGALVVVTVNGTDYTLSRTMTFKANKQHKFTVTLNKVNNGVNVGIGGWEEDEEDYGGDAE